MSGLGYSEFVFVVLGVIMGRRLSKVYELGRMDAAREIMTSTEAEIVIRENRTSPWKLLLEDYLEKLTGEIAEKKP